MQDMVVGPARRLTAVLITLSVGLAACSGASSPSANPGGAPSSGSDSGAAGASTDTGGAGAPSGSTAAGGGAGSGLFDAAGKVTDVCTLLPTDLVARLIPDASAPESQKFPPLKCRVSNGTAALEITLSPFEPVDPLVPAESVSGFPFAAYLQTQFVDDSYLKVLLGQDQGALYVEVAGHDGKDHKDDAIAIAQAVIAQLH